MTTSLLNQILIRLEDTSSDYSDEIKKYAINLDIKGLPIIFSTEHLALMIGVSPNVLKSIIQNSTSFYSSYWIKKKMGGNRLILAPKEPLKHIQNWLRINILEKIVISEHANGFVSKKSIYTNAIAHNNNEVVLNVDLYKFFDSISVKRVFGILSYLGYIKNLAFDMALLLCTKPPPKYWEDILKEGIIKISPDESDTIILPQGSPASPVISNILCFNLDKKLFGLAKKLNCNYSRYADDLTFSGCRKNIPSINTIKKIIDSEHFFINKKKIKYLHKNKRQLVTGIVVNNGIKVLKNKKRLIQTHLYFCSKYGVQSHLEYLEKKGIKRRDNYKQWLLGNICFINSIEKETAAKMFQQFKNINWEL